MADFPVFFGFAAVCAALLQWLRSGGIRFSRGLLPAATGLLLLVAVPQFPTTGAGTFTVGWVQGNGPAGYFDARNPGEAPGPNRRTPSRGRDRACSRGPSDRAPRPG